MRKYFTLAFVLISFVSANAQYTWVNKNLFPDSGRYDAASFTINGMGYIIGGVTNYSPVTLSNHVWQYNPITDNWSAKRNYSFRIGAGGFFSISGKGYVIGGVDSAGVYRSNNNEYDPVGDTWTPKSPFPENGCGGGFYFAINGIGYIGAGVRVANVHGTVTGYSYNPASDTWAAIANYPGNPSIAMTTFSIDSFGYAGMGGDGNGHFYTDMYKYSPATNSWSQIPSFPGTARFADMSSFVINGKAYVGTGESPLNGGNPYCLGDYYMYDPLTNTWSPAPGLQGPPRYAGATFTFGDSAYLVGGQNQDGAIFYRYVDEFKPTGSRCSIYDTTHITTYDTTHISVTDTLFISVTVGIAPNTIINTLKIYPNPAHNLLFINTGNYSAISNYSLKVINPLSQTVFQNAFNQPIFTINISSWATGTYFLQILDATSTVVETKEIVIQ